jgi:L-glyceraldehyde 3-phosphate reductase
LLKDKRITSLVIGASSVNQLKDNLASLDNVDFTNDELQQIEIILKADK